MDVGASEDGAFWLAFLRPLDTMGISGVELVMPDADQGQKQAIATVFAGDSWQRRRTYFLSNLLTPVPKRSQPAVAAMVRTIYKQLSPEEVYAQADRVIAQLREHSPRLPRCWQTLCLTSWPSPPCRCLTGRSCGPTTPWIG